MCKFFLFSHISNQSRMHAKILNILNHEDFGMGYVLGKNDCAASTRNLFHNYLILAGI